MALFRNIHTGTCCAFQGSTPVRWMLIAARSRHIPYTLLQVTSKDGYPLLPVVPVLCDGASLVSI